jgi:hypothetical protein
LTWKMCVCVCVCEWDRAAFWQIRNLIEIHNFVFASKDCCLEHTQTVDNLFKMLINSTSDVIKTVQHGNLNDIWDFLSILWIIAF